MHTGAAAAEHAERDALPEVAQTLVEIAVKDAHFVDVLQR